jgi:hypothetical protein
MNEKKGKVQETLALQIHKHIVNMYEYSGVPHLSSEDLRNPRLFVNVPDNKEFSSLVSVFLRKLGKDGLKPRGMKVFNATWDGREGDEAQLLVVGNGKKFVIRTFLERTRHDASMPGYEGYFRCVIRPYGNLSREIKTMDPLLDHFMQRGIDPNEAQHYADIILSFVGSINPHELELPSESGKLVFNSKHMQLHYLDPTSGKTYIYSHNPSSMNVTDSAGRTSSVHDGRDIPRDFLGSVKLMHNRIKLTDPNSPLAQIASSFYQFVRKYNLDYFE